jgi:hypothetical protein
VFAAYIRRPAASLLLPQDGDDLLFLEPDDLIVRLLPGDGLYLKLEEI